MARRPRRCVDHPETINALTALDQGNEPAWLARTAELARDLGQWRGTVRDALRGIFFLECVGMVDKTPKKPSKVRLQETRPGVFERSTNVSMGLDPESR